MSTRQTVSFESLFNITEYPSGETHVHMVPTNLGNHIDVIAAEVRDFDDLGHVVVADRILKGQARWFIPFMPFARDDRCDTPNDGFELGIAMKMLDGMDVTILDPHSDVAGLLPHIHQREMFCHWQLPEQYVHVVPDTGAAKKVRPGPNDRVYCHKKRDPVTGELSGFSIIEGAELIEGRHCVIVDDICDGGGTFLGLAQLIHEHKPETLSLAVTHGLFTQGVLGLLQEFDHIFTAGSSIHGAINTTPYGSIWRLHNAT